MPRGSKQDTRLFARNEAIYVAYVCGATQDQLAVEYNLTQARISDIVAETSERLKGTFRNRVEEMKLEQTCQLQDVYHRARKSYEPSLRDAETTKVFSGAGDGDGRAEKTTKRQAGDASFQREMRGALKDIRDIWPGFNAPKTTQLSGDPDNPIVIEDGSNLSEYQRAAVLKAKSLLYQEEAERILRNRGVTPATSSDTPSANGNVRAG